MDIPDIQKMQAEIATLKNANNELRQMLNDVVKRVIDNNAFSETIMKEMKVQTERILDLHVRMDNLPYEILDPLFKDKYTSIPRIMTEKETIDEIVLNKKSIARFGDGEFALMFGDSRWRFQKVDDRLAKRLREVVISQDNNILIGLINFYGSLSHRSVEEASIIRSYITPKVRAQHMELLPESVKLVVL